MTPPLWTVIIRPIRSHKSCTVKSILISPGTERYCGSAHTSWEQRRSHRTQLKKKREKRKESINISSNYSLLSGPDQSLDSHSPTGRDGSFVSSSSSGRAAVRLCSLFSESWQLALPVHHTASETGGKGEGRACQRVPGPKHVAHIELFDLVLCCFLVDFCVLFWFFFY